jgi:hypothetical protein
VAAGKITFVNSVYQSFHHNWRGSRWGGYMWSRPALTRCCVETVVASTTAYHEGYSVHSCPRPSWRLSSNHISFRPLSLACVKTGRRRDCGSTAEPLVAQPLRLTSFPFSPLSSSLAPWHFDHPTSAVVCIHSVVHDSLLRLVDSTDT